MSDPSGSWLLVIPVGMAGVLGVVVVVGFVALGVLLARAERLVKSAEPRLATLPCPRCGVPIGGEAAAGAKAAYDEKARKLREMAGSRILRLRIDPCWRFPCPTCGASLRFDPGETRAPLTAA